MVGEKSFTVDDEETVDDVVAEFERASKRAREIASRIDLDAIRQAPHCGALSLRWIYLVMMQEFARHAGHNDILHEQIAANRNILIRCHSAVADDSRNIGVGRSRQFVVIPPLPEAQPWVGFAEIPVHSVASAA